MILKYVMTDRSSFALFSETAKHSEIARGLYGNPVGAGFAHISIDRSLVKVRCYGESVSLGIGSREEDGRIISEKINNQY